MTTLPQSRYLTATSLTARQINRRILLNIIHKNQPLSRADAARLTGLQRSTVSLIVDELIAEGWVIEGEFGRIPRGRRPVYLHMNVETARLLGLYITNGEILVAEADLNGKIISTVNTPLKDFSELSLRKALQQISELLKENLADLSVKGIGVACSITDCKPDKIKTLAEEILGACTILDSIAVACGEWFLLTSEDAKDAEGHLVTIYAADHLEMGISIAGQPLRGVHGKAGSQLSEQNSEMTVEALADRVAFAVSAYDPGLILITGPFPDKTETLKKTLEDQLKKIGSSPDIVRFIETGFRENSVYLKGAVALILNHYLTECPV